MYKNRASYLGEITIPLSRRRRKTPASQFPVMQGRLSAVFIPVGSDLSCQRHDAVVFSLLFHDAAKNTLNVGILDQQAHAAAQLSLDGPGCRSNPVLDVMLQEQIPKSQSLLVVYKQDVPAKIRIKH